LPSRQELQDKLIGTALAVGRFVTQRFVHEGSSDHFKPVEDPYFPNYEQLKLPYYDPLDNIKKETNRWDSMGDWSERSE